MNANGIKLLRGVLSAMVAVSAFAGATRAADWNLVFEDDFERAEPGDDYTMPRGETYSIKNGQLFLKGRGATVYINRPFAMDLRLEFDCMAWPGMPPCDLAVMMNEAYLIAFGARDNRANHILGHGLEVVDLDPPFIIEPGKQYHMVAQREGKRITYEVNGILILEGSSDDLLGGPSFDRVGFLTYAGMLVDHVRVYERSEPHPDTKTYLSKLPPLPIEREGRVINARRHLSDRAQQAVLALNAGRFDEARKLFDEEEDITIKMVGLALLYGDVGYAERPAYGRHTLGEDYGELGMFARQWSDAATKHPDNALLQGLLPAVQHFGKLVMNRSSRNEARLLTELGPEHNPFYYKAVFYKARYQYWGGMEGANSEEKNQALNAMRELFALWPENEVLQEYVGKPVTWGKELEADTEKDPAWAAYLREAYARELAILSRFCEMRQMPDGQFGGGWGDDVEMMRKWVPISAISSCAQTVRTGIERLAEGIWTITPRGFHDGIADVEHTAEPTADTFPTMLLLRHGDPRYYEFNLRSCKTIEEVMIGTDPSGYPRFKSTLVGASGVIGQLGLEDRLQGGGDTGYHARAMKHFLWLAWYGNQQARNLYLDWVDGWRNTAMIDAPDKPAGVLPGTIWYPSGSYNPPNGETWYSPNAYNYYGTFGLYFMLHRSFMAAYALSGNRAFLHPVQRMMDIATYGPYRETDAPPGSQQWFRQHLAHQADSTTTALYRMLTGERVYDEYTRRFGTAPQVYQIDHDLKRYETSFEQAAKSLRHNLSYWTTEVQATDRHHLPAVAEVWGAYTGAITTTVDAEFPTMGVTYETPDANFAAMVTENTTTRLRIHLYSFWDRPTTIHLKLWRLRPGKYIMIQGEQLPGEQPFQSRYGWQEPSHVTILHKGDLCAVTLPSHKTWVVDLRLHEAITTPDQACDLAIHPRDTGFDGHTLAAMIHNIGNAPAEHFTVALQRRQGATWETLAKRQVDFLSHPIDYTPSTTQITLPLPDTGPQTGLRIILDPGDDLFELCELNNIAMVTPEPNGHITPIEQTVTADRTRLRTLRRTIRKTAHVPYLVHLPTEYETARQRIWPVILFLHGAGERSTDLAKLKSLGPLAYAATHEDCPFIIVAPQCPLQQDWSPDTLNALLDEVLQQYRIDRDRIYLTGFSMGGAGTWELAMDHAERFAAIAPLCGRVIPLLCGNLWKMPIWVFHGKKDDVVPPSQSEEIVGYLRGMGNQQVQFTIYPDAGHGIWTQTYNDPALYAWFLKHKCSDRNAQPASEPTQ